MENGVAIPKRRTGGVRRVLRDPYLLFARTLFDPVAALQQGVRKLRSLPVFVSNLRAYQRENRHSSLRFSLRHAWYRSFDRFSDAGVLTFHYFHQDLWAATLVHDSGVVQHVDVGSRVDGFIAHVLPFCAVTYVDARPIRLDWPGFSFRQGLVTDLPFEDGSVDSLSCLHVIEHVGLGRYGDPIDPDGHVRAAAELTRVLAVGGRMLIGTPVGRERLCFDAHRVLGVDTVMRLFDSLQLKSFSLVDDRGEFVRDANFDQARVCEYGCGLFEFSKTSENERAKVVAQ